MSSAAQMRAQHDRVFRALIVHGIVVLAAGLGTGVLWAVSGTVPAATGRLDLVVVTVPVPVVSTDQRAYRVAHMEGLLNGFLMLLVAALVKVADFRMPARRILIGLLATGYGNVVGATVGLLYGVRGFTSEPPAANRVVYGAFMVAIAGVVVALGSLAVAAWKGHKIDDSSTHLPPATPRSAKDN